MIASTLGSQKPCQKRAACASISCAIRATPRRDVPYSGSQGQKNDLVPARGETIAELRQDASRGRAGFSSVLI